MIGKRVQLLFDLSQSSLITDEYLDTYELMEPQLSIGEALDYEEERKKDCVVGIDSAAAAMPSFLRDEFDLPLIGSVFHATQLANLHHKDQTLKLNEVNEALEWQLPDTVKPARGPSFSQEESERLYTIQDIFNKMQGEDIIVIG